ncbi:MAG: BrnA antitoxin family protein [Candidatus Vogelbacteria bacterium]|nr:BrnA antitoxin family protein [Candidatus Vogelbacteria bacterium]
MKKQIKIPRFRNEQQERDFWSKLNLDRHFEQRDFERISFSNLKPSSRSISIRLPKFLLARLKEKANELDIPYQSLIKKYIARGVIESRRGSVVVK